MSSLWKGHAICLCIVPILVYVLLKWALSLHFQRRANLCCLLLSVAPIKFFHQLFPHPSSLPVSPPLLYRDSKLSFKSPLTLPLFPNKICFHGCPSWKHVLQLLHSLPNILSSDHSPLLTEIIIRFLYLSLLIGSSKGSFRLCDIIYALLSHLNYLWPLPAPWRFLPGSCWQPLLGPLKFCCSFCPLYKCYSLEFLLNLLCSFFMLFMTDLTSSQGSQIYSSNVMVFPELQICISSCLLGVILKLFKTSYSTCANKTDHLLVPSSKWFLTSLPIHLVGHFRTLWIILNHCLIHLTPGKIYFLSIQ